MAADTYKCPKCNKEFLTQEHLDQHTNRVHPMAPVPDDVTQGRSKDAGARPDGETPERGGINKTRHPF